MVVVWFSFVGLACTLSSTSEDPPTVEPRNTSTPIVQATPLSYATPSGTEDVPVISEQQQQEIEVALFNLINRIEKDRLMLHVTNLVNFGTRHVNSPTDRLDYGVGAAANYIKEEFETIQAQSRGNFTYFEQPFTASYNGISTTQRNLVGFIPGTDEGAGVIVIGAHYDSRTYDLTDATAFAPGAADNGSGVAAVIEMARVMSDRPRRATIMFVLFAAEEVNRQGSKAFVRDYIQQYNIQDVVMINVDTIGNWNDPTGLVNDTEIRLFSSPPNDSPGRQLARTINFVAFIHELDLEIWMEDAIDREGRFGDHNSFDEAGYPAVRFIERLEDTSMREGDDRIEGVEAEYLSRATRTILGVVEILAAGPPPPPIQNITLRDMGTGSSMLVWEPVVDADHYIVGLRTDNSLIYQPYFVVSENFTNEWDNSNWQQFDRLAIASVDRNGLIGQFSQEYLIKGS